MKKNIICRRCDFCGVRMELLRCNEKQTVLECPKCKKQMNFEDVRGKFEGRKTGIGQFC